MIEIHPGAHVYGRRGGYVGVVEAAAGSLMRVRAIEPLSRVYYVPTSAVVGSMPGGRELFLECTCDELTQQGWLHAPHGNGEQPDSETRLAH